MGFCVLRRGELILTCVTSGKSVLCGNQHYCCHQSDHTASSESPQSPIFHHVCHCCSISLCQSGQGSSLTYAASSSRFPSTSIYPICADHHKNQLLWFWIKMALEGASLSKRVRLHDAGTYLKDPIIPQIMP